MAEALIAAGAAVLVGVLSLIGVIITNRKNAVAMECKLEASSQLTQVQIAELTREVREHNNFARRMPVVEEQIKVINHRLDDLERK